MGLRNVLFVIAKQEIQPLKDRMEEVLNDVIEERLSYFDDEYSNAIRRLYDYYYDDPAYTEGLESLLRANRKMWEKLEQLTESYQFAVEKVAEVDEMMYAKLDDTISIKTAQISPGFLDDCVLYLDIIMGVLDDDVGGKIEEVAELVEEYRELVDKGALPVDVEEVLADLAFVIYEGDRESLASWMDSLLYRTDRVKKYTEKKLRPYVY